MYKSVIILLLLSLSWIPAAHAKGDIAKGKLKSVTCAACHGADGQSVNPLWPNLAGQNPKYLVQQLEDFKKGKDGGRYDPSMSTMVATLSTQDMEDLAAYYSSQFRVVPGVDPKTVESGEMLYRGGDIDQKIPTCSACHGPQGLGISSAGFPALGGQHPEYIVKQLKDFQSSTRQHGVNVIMVGVTKRMTEKDMQDVAKYVAALH